MVMKIVTREACKSDLDWINEQYAAVGFLPSNLEDEQIVICERDGEKAGVGRLRNLNGQDAELGGIYVLEQHRSRSVAKTVVAALVAKGEMYRRIFCLPFEHLRAFYESFGFRDMGPEESVPDQIQEKMNYCTCSYESNVLLLIKCNDR